jgi:putative ABC transport system ATP-binding protein
MLGLPLVASELSLRLGGTPVLDKLSLALAAGQLTARAGPSGSGKSSLLYVLSGLLRADGGEVRWGEVRLDRLGEAARDSWRRQHAGFVFQNFQLVDEMSPLDNVLLPAWFGRWSAAGLKPRARTLLDELGVPQRRRADLLSRGEQQRVAICRALLLDPPVVLADEPTASLDAKAGAEVGAILSRLAQEGRTVVVASHDPEFLQRADRVLRLEHGQLAEREALPA